MAVLSLNNVHLTMNDELGKNKILDDVSLSFDPKKIYVITGPNGGGKSTLAKYIMGIKKGEEGNITLDGEDITDLNIVERSKKGIGYAFQTPARFKGLKVRKLLELSKGNGTKNIYKSLKDVGLCPEDYLERNMDGSFSGGEIKRVEIASVLIRDLKVAVFDEPEAGIDLWSFQRMTETFKELNQNTDTCIIIISHQERIMALADEIIVLDKGKVIERTTNKKFLESMTHGKDSCKKCCSL
ncbi:ABC transporter ATP-binding protein [Fusobacterium sp. MFO224]|uniref:ABC transporter ATP-binding protein n=1 Tax=Fusobacterium sp. MFO224 TaxID=3378070 RepID=UPI003853D005